MNLFTYGTLMWPEVLEAVTGLRCNGEPATLRGFKRLRVKGAVYPVIAESTDDEVEGKLYRNLPESVLHRLDAFEGEIYDRRTVELEAGPAYAYVLSGNWTHIADSICWHPDQLTSAQLESVIR